MDGPCDQRFDALTTTVQSSVCRSWLQEHCGVHTMYKLNGLSEISTSGVHIYKDYGDLQLPQCHSGNDSSAPEAKIRPFDHENVWHSSLSR